MIKSVFLLFIISTIGWSEMSQFRKFWYDGKAEISTYTLYEMRYGELRKGTRVLVFVTEPLRLSNLIKPDRNIAPDAKIEVLKLNDIRKFNTGIYDYSVMTSVFSSVEHKADMPFFRTVKTSFTSQEWCGNVFELLQRKGNHFLGNLFSYFESEGNNEYSIALTKNLITEDNLWILIRELNGPVYTLGENLSFDILPSSWSRRKAHEKIKAKSGTLKKEFFGDLTTEIGIVPSNVFTWQFSGKKTQVWVERAYPHRILKYQERDGSYGTILASKREPYWQQNSNQHSQLRHGLQL